MLKRETVWTWAVPALAVLLLFLPTLTGGLVYDDIRLLADPREGLPAVGPVPPFYREVTQLTHLLDGWLWGGWPAGLHLTNVLLHAAATALVAATALALSRSRRMAFLTGLLFAVHPVHVEAIASVANRKDILAMIFVCLALMAWLGIQRPLLRCSVAGLLLGLALLSKEVAAAGLLGMLFLVELLWRPREPGLPLTAHRPLRVARGMPLLFISALLGSGAMAIYADHFHAPAIYATSGGQLRSYGEVLRNSAAAIPQDLRLLAWPARISADYPLPAGSGGAAAWEWGVAILLAWAGTGAALARRAPLTSFALLWPLVMVAPCSNLLPLTEFFVADRYLYVPSLGACLLAALALDALADFAARSGSASGKAAVISLAALLMASGAIRSFERCRDWHDSYSLWFAARRSGYSTWRVNHNLGVELYRRGKVDKAIPLLRDAVTQIPQRLSPRRVLAAALLDGGRIDDGENECRQLVRQIGADPGCEYLLREAERRKAAAGRGASVPGAAGPGTAGGTRALEGLARVLEDCSGGTPAACAEDLGGRGPG
jgi:hypothetical protein